MGLAMHTRPMPAHAVPLWHDEHTLLLAVWALDFMRDTLYSGKVFRTLNVID